MKREELKEQGLTEEQIDFVMKKNGEDIEGFKNLEIEKQNLETQLEKANETIEDFKKMNIDEIQKAADDYKKKYETAQTEAQKEIDRLKFEHQLDNTLTKFKARNNKAVRALLDFDENATIEDIEKQLESVKEENDYLFESEETNKIPTFVRPGGDNTKQTSGSIDIGSLAEKANIRGK